MAIHGKTGGRRPQCKPQFFKVLLGDFKQRLKIPPKFMKHITKEASQIVVLKVPNRSSWKVELTKTTVGNFLSTGWSDFVKNYSLKEGEFLVFKYFGNKEFSVKIFDTSGCEKEDAFEKDSWKKPKNEGNNKTICRVKCSQDINVFHQIQSRGNNAAQGASSEPVRTETEDIGRLITRKPRRDIIYISSRRAVTNIERAEAEKAANSFCSTFPYTVICMTATAVHKVFVLRFPSCFSRVHLPKKKTDMVLREPSGKVWKVVYTPNHGKSVDIICGGWPAFVLDNNLEEGDFCAFELIGEFDLKVHIFRVVEEITPLRRVSASHS